MAVAGFSGNADPQLGVPVQMGRDHEIWVASDNRGGYWINHIRLVPDEWKDPRLHR
jgi:hypothetical protein